MAKLSEAQVEELSAKARPNISADLKQIRDIMVGVAKAASTDLPGLIADVADRVSGNTSTFGEKDRSSQMFKAITGLDSSGSLSEIIGGVLSPGGAAKAMVVGAARLSKVRGNKFAQEAEELIADGAKMKDVYNATGVYKDVDWGRKSIISDEKASVTQLRADGPLSKSFSHPELFAVYPEIASYPVTTMPGKNSSFNTGTKQIKIGVEGGTDEMRKSYLHEIQHAIQNIEGFGNGGSPAQFMKFDVVATETAIAQAKMSKNPVTQQMAANLQAKLSEAKKNATDQYLRVPGEQEARFTELTSTLGEDNLAKMVMSLLNKNETPSNRIAPYTPKK